MILYILYHCMPAQQEKCIGQGKIIYTDRLFTIPFPYAFKLVHYEQEMKDIIAGNAQLFLAFVIYLESFMTSQKMHINLVIQIPDPLSLAKINGVLYVRKCTFIIRLILVIRLLNMLSLGLLQVIQIFTVTQEVQGVELYLCACS